MNPYPEALGVASTLESELFENKSPGTFGRGPELSVREVEGPRCCCLGPTEASEDKTTVASWQE